MEGRAGLDHGHRRTPNALTAPSPTHTLVGAPAHLSASATSPLFLRLRSSLPSYFLLAMHQLMLSHSLGRGSVLQQLHRLSRSSAVSFHTQVLTNLLARVCRIYFGWVAVENGLYSELASVDEPFGAVLHEERFFPCLAT